MVLSNFLRGERRKREGGGRGGGGREEGGGEVRRVRGKRGMGDEEKIG